MTMKIKHNLLRIRFLLFATFLGLISSLGFANQQHVVKQNTDNQVWFTQDPHHKQDVQLHVELYLSSTCPHCRAANQFFHQLETKKRWLSIHRYYINKDKVALDRWNDLVLAQKIKIAPFAVPAIFFCDSRWLGFDSTKTTGKEISKGLTYCHKQIMATGKLTPMTVNALRKSGMSEWFESTIAGHPSWHELIFTLAGLDVITSCSLVGFLVIFSLLFLMPRAKLRVVFSGLFLLCIGLIHYCQQVHTALFYDILRWMRWPTACLGLLLLGLLISCYRKKQPCSQLDFTLKGLLLGSVAVLTVAGVYSYYQTCIPNFSFIFQQYLTTQSLPLHLQLFYSVVYQIIYLLALALLLVFALAGSARLIKYHHLLYKIACLVLLFAALFLIVYPILLE